MEHPSLLKVIIKKSELIDYALNYCGMLFTILLMAMTAVNVIGRQIFNSPVEGYIDAEEMMMALLVFLSLPYCQLKDGNIRFELFMSSVFKKGRSYHLVETLYLLFSLLGFALIAYYTTETAIYSYVSHDVSATVHWPAWPARWGAAIGSIFLCIRLIFQMIENLSMAIEGKRIEKSRWIE